MKKLSNFLSPFIMLIFPVVLFVSLSLVFKDEYKAEENSSKTIVSKASLISKANGVSVIKYLISK